MQKQTQNIVKNKNPFGSPMIGRDFSVQNYHYGFNGQEKDNEVKGNGNSLDFGARIYDSRLGRFLSLDPKYKIFPSLSAYCYAANNPIFLIDKDGEGPEEPSNTRWHNFRYFIKTIFCKKNDNPTKIKVNSCDEKWSL